MDEEAQGKIGEELYDWEGRFGGHKQRTWRFLDEEEQALYLEEARFILKEFVETVLGYRKPLDRPELDDLAKTIYADWGFGEWDKLMEAEKDTWRKTAAKIQALMIRKDKPPAVDYEKVSWII